MGEPEWLDLGDDRWVPELGLGDEVAATALVAALRPMLRATSAREVVTAVAEFVVRLGGSLVRAADDRGLAIPLDIGFGAVEPVMADAPAMSVARMRLEQYLPWVVEDARVRISELRRGRDLNAAGEISPGWREFWSAVTRGETVEASAVVATMQDSGVPASALIQDVLVPAQRRVGELWQRGRWTVADEHAATAVVDSALAVVESAPREATCSTVAVVCAESEWHTMPARMFAELLRHQGMTVRFLGGSMPADHLREYLVRMKPDAVVVSATLGRALLGAARTIAAARTATPLVIAGGRAFGVDDRRALAVGADAWADSAERVAELVSAGPAPRINAEPDLAPALSLLARRADVIDMAVRATVPRGLPGEAEDGSDAESAPAIIRDLLDWTIAALAVNDVTVLDDFTDWLVDVMDDDPRRLARLQSIYKALASSMPATGQAAGLLASQSPRLASPKRH